MSLLARLSFMFRSEAPTCKVTKMISKPTSEEQSLHIATLERLCDEYLEELALEDSLVETLTLGEGGQEFIAKGPLGYELLLDSNEEDDKGKVTLPSLSPNDIVDTEKSSKELELTLTPLGVIDGDMSDGVEANKGPSPFTLVKRYISKDPLIIHPLRRMELTKKVLKIDLTYRPSPRQEIFYVGETLLTKSPNGSGFNDEAKDILDWKKLKRKRLTKAKEHQGTRDIARAKEDAHLRVPQLKREIEHMLFLLLLDPEIDECESFGDGQECFYLKDSEYEDFESKGALEEGLEMNPIFNASRASSSRDNHFYMREDFATHEKEMKEPSVRVELVEELEHPLYDLPRLPKIDKGRFKMMSSTLMNEPPTLMNDEHTEGKSLGSLPPLSIN